MIKNVQKILSTSGHSFLDSSLSVEVENSEMGRRDDFRIKLTINWTEMTKIGTTLREAFIYFREDELNEVNHMLINATMEIARKKKELAEEIENREEK